MSTQDKYRYWKTRIENDLVPETLGELIDLEKTFSFDIALKDKGKRIGFRPWKRAKLYSELLVPMLEKLGNNDTIILEIHRMINICEIKAWLEVVRKIP